MFSSRLASRVPRHILLRRTPLSFYSTEVQPPSLSAPQTQAPPPANEGRKETLKKNLLNGPTLDDFIVMDKAPAEGMKGIERRRGVLKVYKVIYKNIFSDGTTKQIPPVYLKFINDMLYGRE